MFSTNQECLSKTVITKKSPIVFEKKLTQRLNNWLWEHNREHKQKSKPTYTLKIINLENKFNLRQPTKRLERAVTL